MMLQLAFMVVSLILAVALAPKAPVPKPAALSDFDVPVSEQGRELPWVFGEGEVKGYNVVWYGDLSTYAIRKKAAK